MNAENQNQNQRKSFRCTVADARQHCELRAGSRVQPARLLDESAGGFAVLVDNLAGLNTNQTAELRTDAGWFAICVVHVTEIHPTDNEITATGKAGPWFRLGLLRVGETALPDESTVSLLAGGLHFHLTQWCPSGGMLMVLGVLLAVVVVVVPMGWIGEHWLAGQSGANRLLQWSDRQIKSQPHEPSPNFSQAPANDSPFARSRSEVWGNGSAFDDGSSPFGANGGRTEKPTSSAGQSNRHLHDTVVRLPGAAPLTLPEIVQKLQLTADQQEQVHQLMEATSKAMRNLDSQLQGQQRHRISELRADLLDRARREALGLLTGKQRAQWDALTGGR